MESVERDKDGWRIRHNKTIASDHIEAPLALGRNARLARIENDSYVFNTHDIQHILSGDRFKLNDPRFKETQKLTHYRAEKI